jgi:hypothetical protein
MVRNSLLLAPVRRLFWRSGWILKIVIGYFALQFVAQEVYFAANERFFSAVLFYLVVAGICYYFEHRAQHEAPLQPTEKFSDPKVGHSSANAGAQAMKALEAPVTSGMVAPAYLERASAAIGKAVPMLYGPLILPMAL